MGVIRTLLQGELIHGTDDGVVTAAVFYNRQEIEQTNTLVFLSRKEEVSWEQLKRCGPCVIITDIPVADLADGHGQTIIRVKNLVQAQWRFIEYYRGLFDIPVITITGTCGKTTTKEMIKHLLSVDHNVQASISSINEPRKSFGYLLGIDDTTDVAVFEHGLGNPGNITHQCMIYQPTIGIITNIGAHHLDGCKTLEGYIQAKGEIVKGVAPDGVLILNADDQNTKQISLADFTGKVVYIGVNDTADLRATDIRYGHGGMQFTLHLRQMKYPVFVPGFGEHQVYNALAALAAVHEIGIGISEAAKRLATFGGLQRHLEMSEGIGGSTIIDDTWTINPTSVEAALKVLDHIGQGKKVVLLLGDIKRLGDYELQYHQQIGSLVAKRKVHTLITIGTKAEEIAKQAKRDGFRGKIHAFPKVTPEIEAILEKTLDPNSLLLIKGPMSSRSMIELAERLKNHHF
ncbi:UDP-N-acetylmuramoyl-tripeptide--D-alanyl-D-alanine ligase [Brevibacillus dissolubilis]|uniref:UDP-N-acetylmuramoyl-tripeptide--D-alanyl-D- alanine ligase n=1 Tax=Brevibacillus dissolubilis TaxID=1844116 RepID=UPI0021005941|nr:UDP-N-acetylmuramoyl-tripeptide--D-alanyl-D-alanine ligase [Brevibacillus dissolubilis]